MDGKIDTVREALNELQGLIHHIERTTGHEYDSRKLHAAIAALSAVDPDAIRRECAYKAKQAILSAPYDNPTRAYAAALAEAAILSAEPAPASTPWSRFEIGMLAAMMTGNLDKDTATLTGYLAAEPAQDAKAAQKAADDRAYAWRHEMMGDSEPAQDDGKPILPMFPLQNGNEGDWIIDFDFLMAIQKEYRDADDYGKPSLEEIEEILLVLMRSAEVKRRLEEAKE